MSKTLTEKYSSLSVQLDKVINEANSEITNMQNKLASKGTHLPPSQPTLLTMSSLLLTPQA